MQPQDQTYEYAPNAALLRNFETGTPVRVLRAVQAPAGSGARQQYVYEGLYQVAEHKRVPGRDGVMVSG
jgi:hypothetical protein